MRKKSTLKRMLAGILAMSTALSAVPMQMATTVLAAEDYTSESNAEYMYELLNYLSELGDDYGLPPIMISEGDKVFIDGQEVATTVVPINKDLVNKQNKIRSEYWLDVLKAGTYDELKADSEALKYIYQYRITKHSILFI